MQIKDNESAVSESIGVIIVVAITVIIASLAAAYLFGMVNTIPQTHILALTAEQVDPDHIYVTYRGGPDQASLDHFIITWPTGAQETIGSPRVGDVYIASGMNATQGPRNRYGSFQK